MCLCRKEKKFAGTDTERLRKRLDRHKCCIKEQSIMYKKDNYME